MERRIFLAITDLDNHFFQLIPCFGWFTVIILVEKIFSVIEDTVIPEKWYGNSKLIARDGQNIKIDSCLIYEVNEENSEMLLFN